MAELVPFLAKNARRSDENRRLSEQVIDALSETGVFRSRTPIRYGGYEAGTRTLVEIAAELGRGDGAAEERAKARADMGAVVGLARQAVTSSTAPAVPRSIPACPFSVFSGTSTPSVNTLSV
nr:acyl-CoA dehydrogenase family protein [Amycolatopsis balhimycina]